MCVSGWMSCLCTLNDIIITSPHSIYHHDNTMVGYIQEMAHKCIDWTSPQKGKERETETSCLVIEIRFALLCGSQPGNFTGHTV